MSISRRSVITEPDDWLAPQDLRKKKLFIAMPTYQGVVTNACALSLFKLTHILRTHNVRQILRMLDGEMVARARNRLVADYLDTDCTDMLCWDSDIGSDDPAQLLRMMQSNLGIVGGVYPKKHIRWQGVFAHSQSPGGTPETVAESAVGYVVNVLEGRRGKMLRDCIEVGYVGTGFMLIQRRVIEAMVRRYPKLSYQDDFVDGPSRRIPALFDYKIVNDRYLSEDWQFCDLWRKMGGHVWASATCKLDHVGRHVYQGDFSRRLRPVQE